MATDRTNGPSSDTLGSSAQVMAEGGVDEEEEEAMLA